MNSFKRDKSFDCFNECIKNESCTRIARYYPHNDDNYSDCYLKNSTELISDKIADAEYFFISGIK